MACKPPSHFRPKQCQGFQVIFRILNFCRLSFSVGSAIDNADLLHKDYRQLAQQ